MKRRISHFTDLAIAICVLTAVVLYALVLDLGVEQ